MSRPRTFSARADPLSLQTPLRLQIPAGLDLYMPVPDDNPLSAEGVALGQQLFFDPVLSRNRTIRCATCHDPERAFTDGHRLSVGIDGLRGTRHAPTLVNRGYGRAFFWDGRASRLEDQVLQPIENPTELALTVEEAIGRLNGDREYVSRFQTAFERRPNAEDLARALASYVRTILSGDSPVDRYLRSRRQSHTLSGPRTQSVETDGRRETGTCCVFAGAQRGRSPQDPGATRVTMFDND